MQLRLRRLLAFALAAAWLLSCGNPATQASGSAAPKPSDRDAVPAPSNRPPPTPGGHPNPRPDMPPAPTQQQRDAARIGTLDGSDPKTGKVVEKTIGFAPNPRTFGPDNRAVGRAPHGATVRVYEKREGEGMVWLYAEVVDGEMKGLRGWVLEEEVRFSK